SSHALVNAQPFDRRALNEALELISGGPESRSMADELPAGDFVPKLAQLYESLVSDEKGGGERSMIERALLNIACSSTTSVQRFQKVLGISLQGDRVYDYGSEPELLIEQSSDGLSAVFQELGRSVEKNRTETAAMLRRVAVSALTETG